MEHLILWPDLPTLLQLALALGVGLFVGLERERRGKEAGLRTFALVALLGALGGLLGELYAALSLVLVGILVVFLNVAALRADEGVELTTSAALLVTGFAGVLCGLGQTFTPVAIGIITAALLAWKERLAGFSLGLTDAEVRAAILLALITFVIYPVLPAAPLDPWGLVEPRTAWLTVILIAAIGFANYILLKLYGSRGVEVAGFLGGVVNSTVTVTELALRARESGEPLVQAAYRGTLLSTAAMVLRNGLLLGIFAPTALVTAALPLALMLGASVGLALRARAQPARAAALEAPPLQLGSPFSLPVALRFGLIFLGLQVAGGLAERALGPLGFYTISLVGGLVSSASAVAAAATLAARGALPTAEAGTGAVLASLASALVNLLLVMRVTGDTKLTWRLARSLGVTAALGVLGALLQGVALSIPLLPGYPPPG
jgi:uncharacterized membrane protein (DUF4010 family)